MSGAVSKGLLGMVVLCCSTVVQGLRCLYRLSTDGNVLNRPTQPDYETGLVVFGLTLVYDIPSFFWSVRRLMPRRRAVSDRSLFGSRPVRSLRQDIGEFLSEGFVARAQQDVLRGWPLNV